MNLKILIVVLLSLSSLMDCAAQQKKKKDKAITDTGYSQGETSSGGTGKFYYGREIARVISPSGISWLERENRPEEENTQLAIDKIEIPEDAVIADIGAGSGYYTFKLTKKVPKGKVYAVEIQDEMIRFLENRKTELKDDRVEIIKGSISTPNLPANSVDLAIMVDVYHELEYPREMLQAISQSLKPKGKLLLIEYRGEDEKVKIQRLHKTTVAQLSRELDANGFKLSYRGDFMPIQHFLLFEKR